MNNRFSGLSASVRMSKNKNGGLDQYDPERFGRPILSQSEEVCEWKG